MKPWKVGCLSALAVFMLSMVVGPFVVLYVLGLTDPVQIRAAGRVDGYVSFYVALFAGLIGFFWSSRRRR